MTASAKQSRAGRNRARRVLMQVLYQSLLNEQPLTEIKQQFSQRDSLAGVDIEFFDDLLAEIDRARTDYDELIGRYADRPVVQLDPVERAIIYGAIAELNARSDVPYRVVISEAVTLAKQFGGTDGHKFVNALLDRAAAELRPQETGGERD